MVLIHTIVGRFRDAEIASETGTFDDRSRRRVDCADNLDSAQRRAIVIVIP